MGRRQELSIHDKNIAFGFQEAVKRVADVARSFEGIYIQFIVCKHVFNSEKDRPRSGRPGIAKPCELRFMVMPP